MAQGPLSSGLELLSATKEELLAAHDRGDTGDERRYGKGGALFAHMTSGQATAWLAFFDEPMNHECGVQCTWPARDDLLSARPAWPKSGGAGHGSPSAAPL